MTSRAYEIEEAFGCLLKVPLVILIIIASVIGMFTVVPAGFATVLCALAAGFFSLALLISPGVIALLTVVALGVLAALVIASGAAVALALPMLTAVFFKICLLVIRWVGSGAMRFAQMVGAGISTAAITTHRDVQRLVAGLRPRAQPVARGTSALVRALVHRKLGGSQERGHSHALLHPRRWLTK